MGSPAKRTRILLARSLVNNKLFLYTLEQLALELDILSNNNHSDDEEGKGYYVYSNLAASQPSW
jgi:hypothetical protein